MRAAAQAILKDNDLEGAFWVDKPNPGTLHINRISFQDSISLTYSIADQRLKAEGETLRWPQVATRMHFRVGSDNDSVSDLRSCSSENNGRPVVIPLNPSR